MDLDDDALDDDALDDDVVVVRRADTLWRDAPGYLVIATVDDEVHEATGPAPGIWRALAGPVTVDELVIELAAAHAVEPEHVRDDVTSFLRQLIDLGLVETRVTTDG